MEINLLPIDLSNKSSSVQSAILLKKAIIVLSGIFLIVVTLGIILILFLSNNINSSLNRQDLLKSEIQKLENVEQKLILIKDRIAKIKETESNVNTADTLVTLNPVISSLPQNVTLDTIDIASDGSLLFKVISKDSLGMATFLNSLVSSGIYKELSLSAFIFEPTTGYQITLTNP